MIYFDQAASSYPKPQIVQEKMMNALANYSANPGRGEHRLANQAASTIYQTRLKAAELFGCHDPNTCLFYQNATVAINQALKGIQWKKGDHIVTTGVEHNAVRRSLEYLKEKHGVHVSYVSYDGDDDVMVEQVKKEITKKTKLLAISHASNVTGDVLPLKELTTVAKEHDLITFVDGSQTIGHIPVHME